MPEETSQATAETIVPQVTVPETAPAGTTQTEPQKETPLTAEDYRRIAHEEAMRVAQSQVAKGENRIQKLIQEKFTALEQTRGTLGLSEEQVNQAKQKIVTEAYSAPEEPVNTVSPDVDQAIQFMNAEIQNVFAELGTTVSPSDPEFRDLQAKVDSAWNDPKGLAKILLAASKAATAKAGRLAKQTETASARVIGGGEGVTSNPNDISGITDSKELYRLGEEKIRGKK